MTDIMTIIWKEWKEFLLQRGSIRATLINVLLMVFVFGVFLPLQVGREWMDSPLSMAAWAWVPLFLVTSMIADSFAGERERHTLETLLASPLSDRVIVLGKMAASVAYALGMTIVLLLAAAVTINVTTWDGKVVFYPVLMVGGALAFGALGGSMVAGLGVLLSLRAATVRQAAQTLSIGIMLLIWIPVLAVQVLPKRTVQEVAGYLARLDGRVALAAAAAVLVLLNGVILALVFARFRRARLVLD